MAIDRTHWRLILEAGRKGKALSAGYPDLLLTIEDIPVKGEYPTRADTYQVQKHHGWPQPMAESEPVFKAIGLELEVIDLAVLQGCERVVDLNQPHDLGEYDLVIDPGTSEHCFNVAQGLVNLAGSVKVGGVISPALPMSMFNHGYWNVNPCALVDFYEANGFKVERLVLRHPGGVFEPKPEDRKKRLKGIPDGTVTIINARRLEARGFRWPQQHADVSRGT